MPLLMVRNDITKMDVDAIVNAANRSLKMGGGVCGAIFSAAGAEELQAECDKLAPVEVGCSVITMGYKLPAKHIIHTVGPVWKGGNNRESELLSDCYKNSLTLALEYELESIAFPIISSGIYGFPKQEAMNIAVEAIRDFLNEHELMVYLVVFDKEAFGISQMLSSDVEQFISSSYVDQHTDSRRSRGNQNLYSPRRIIEEKSELTQFNVDSLSISMEKRKRSIESLIDKVDETFSEMLLRLIDEKGMTDSQAYKKANIDRKLFSKIRSSRDYKPSKATTVAFCFALELNLDETEDLLSKAGFALSHCYKFDIIIEYCIENETYDIYKINQVLFAFDQPLLGA